MMQPEFDIHIKYEGRIIKFHVIVKVINESFECYYIYGKKDKVIILSNRPQIRKHKALSNHSPKFWLIDTPYTFDAYSYLYIIGNEIVAMLEQKY